MPINIFNLYINFFNLVLTNINFNIIVILEGGVVMNYFAPSKCPVCGQTMAITRLQCSHCQTELTGQFTPCRFCKLEEKHLNFVETFLRCRGSIKEVEKVLGVSYPTVRNMLEASLTALGLNDRKTMASGEDDKREEILSQLSQGAIDAETAIAALQSLKGE